MSAKRHCRACVAGTTNCLATSAVVACGPRALATTCDANVRSHPTRTPQPATGRGRAWLEGGEEEDVAAMSASPADNAAACGRVKMGQDI